MEKYVYGKVYLAYGETLYIVSIGDIYLKMSNNVVWKIHNVRHIPKLMCNLVSIGQLDNEGHNVVFTGGVWKVTKSVMVVA